MLTYLFLEVLAFVFGAIAFVVLLVHLWRNRIIHTVFARPGIYIPFFCVLLALALSVLANRTYPPHFAMPSWMHSHAPGGMPPYIPFPNIVSFFMHQDDFFRVDDIGSDPENIPSAPQSPDDDGIVRISLAVREVIAEVTPDVYFNYWTYDEQVPGPFLRIREGDTVELTISNHETSLHAHNIDLHAVTGPGGGATLTNVEPGQTKTFQFKALNPGLYVYHCAMPNVSAHNSHGQYGLILVEPNGGLAPVDKEFYVMQGELYTMGDIGKRGLVAFDAEALIDGLPNYVTFNGRVESTPRMTAQVGDRIRMYVGNGGVNLISSFHAIGEIFDRVYPEGAIGPSSAILENVQTTAVLPGGSTIVEFTVDVPGKYLLVDHALARMNKGAWAVLEVTGEEQPHIFRSIGESEADAFHSAAYH